MSDELEFDGGIVNDDGDYEEDIDEYGDEDENIDDHEHQDEDIDKSGKIQVKKDDEDNDQNSEINQFDDLIHTVTTKKNINRRKVSGYPIISFTEHTKLFSVLCDYLSKSKFDIHPGMEGEDEVLSGDIFRVARFWITNRHKWPLPLSISRHIVGNTFEKVDVNNMLFVEDLDFHDDNHDEYRFHYNFNAKPYGNIC